VGQVFGVVEYGRPVEEEVDEYGVDGRVVELLLLLMLLLAVVGVGVEEYERFGLLDERVAVFFDQDRVVLAHDAREAEYLEYGVEAVGFLLELLGFK
jgi:hypothetical protein